MQERERSEKAKRIRMLARGYKSLKRDKADVYHAAAKALEDVEKRSKPPVAEQLPRQALIA